MDADEVRRELKPKRSGDTQVTSPSPRSRGNRAGNRGRQSPAPARSRQPQASERASMLAQDWYDRGEVHGFSFPYDVNYFALALQRKIERDPEIKPFLDKGSHDQVQRWVSKMIERWWEEYADGTIHAGNAKDFFLGNDWDDLRYYARSCLRAKYLLEHGRRVPPPLYPEQKDYQDRLTGIRNRARINEFLRQQEQRPETPEETSLDPEGRERLRSFVEKRRTK